MLLTFLSFFFWMVFGIYLFLFQGSSKAILGLETGVKRRFLNGSFSAKQVRVFGFHMLFCKIWGLCG